MRCLCGKRWRICSGPIPFQKRFPENKCPVKNTGQAGINATSCGPNILGEYSVTNAEPLSTRWERQVWRHCIRTKTEHAPSLQNQPLPQPNMTSTHKKRFQVYDFEKFSTHDKTHALNTLEINPPLMGDLKIFMVKYNAFERKNFRIDHHQIPEASVQTNRDR